MIYLHKILPLIVSPLFLVLALFILGIIINSKKISLSAIILLIFCSLPVISNKLKSYLESDFELIHIDNAESADAIVVLSGMVKTVKFKNKINYEWGEAVDRIFAGVELIKANKAPTLIFTRGKLPWSRGIPEGEYLRDIAIKLGVPDNNILLTENVENTDQEAKAVIKLFSKKNPKILLVTSAFHMPRAQKVFMEAGFAVLPFPVDFQNSSSKFTIMDFIPSANAFGDTSFFIREMIGRLYYEIKY